MVNIDVKKAKQMAHNEKLMVYRKNYWWIFRCGNSAFCTCDEIMEKDGIFSFVDSKTQSVQGILNKSEFAYATRNY